MAEDGRIPDKYPLIILAESGYRKRTKQNVRDSDATVIIYFDYIYPKGGTELTLLECIKQSKAYLLIDGNEVSIERAAERIYLFCYQNNIKIGEVHSRIISRKNMGFHFRKCTC